MAVRVSPGVYFREIDLSRYVPQLSTTIAGVVGTSPKGPTNKATLVSNVGSFTATFGVPHPNHLATYAAAEFLRYGSQLYFVRINGTDAVTASVNALGQMAAAYAVGTEKGPFAITAEAAASVAGTDTAATVDVTSADKYLLVGINGGPAVEIVLSEGVGVTKAAIAAEIDAALASYGADCASPGNAITITTVEVGSDSRIEIYATSNDAYTLLGFTAGVSYGTENNKTMRVSTIDETGTVVDFSDVTFTEGAARTTDQMVTDLNTQFISDALPMVATNYNGYVKLSHATTGQDYGFKVTTQGASDVILGAAPTLGFEVGALNYGRGSGGADNTVTFEALSEGAWGNDIEVVVTTGSAEDTFRLLVYDNGSLVESFDNLVGSPDQEDLTNGRKYYESAVNGTGADAISKYIHIVDIKTNTAYPLAGTYALTGGDDGLDSISDDDFIGTINGATRTGLKIFSHAEEIDVNLIMAPGIHSASVINEMITICETRGDCMALVDPPIGLGVQQIVDWHNGATVYSDHAAFNSSYAALYWPWLETFDPAYDRYVWTPPSGHVAAAYAYSDEVSEPWFAPAGLNRGRILQVTRVEYPADQGERDTLYGNQNAINPIVKFQRDGIAIWGQRTLQRKPSALDRVNVRRLMLYIRKTISTAVRYLVFEPNDPQTWRAFVALVDPHLKGLVSRRGLARYQVVCDETTNTPDVIDNNEMKAIIFLEPIKAAEKIQIDAVLTPTGASFEELIY